MPHEGAPCEEEVGTGGIEVFVHQEVFLLPPQVAGHLLHSRVEVVTDLRSCHIDRFQSSEERCLIVQRLPAVADEYGRDDEGVVHDEDRACGVPCRIASCLEGTADTPAGERGGIGFLLHEQLSAEILYHTAFSVVSDEGVVLLCRAFGQRLEPVCIVGHPILPGPLHHACSHRIGHLTVQSFPLVYHVCHLFEDIFRQVLEHLLSVEDILAKVLAWSFIRHLYVEGLLLEGLSYYLKSQFVCHSCILLMRKFLHISFCIVSTRLADTFILFRYKAKHFDLKLAYF